MLPRQGILQILCKYKRLSKAMRMGILLNRNTENADKYTGNSFDRRTVTRYAIRHGLLAPKYMRKVSWRLAIKAMPREVVRFIQSRFGELKVSEARYEDLLSEVDEYYPKYLSYIRQNIYSLH